MVVEDNLLYYIRGVVGRGDEVLATLKGKGGVNTSDHLGDNPDCIYFINGTGFINIAQPKSFAWDMCMKYGVELKLSEPRMERWDDITVTNGYLPHIDGTIYYKECRRWRCSYATEQQASSASAAAMLSQIRKHGEKLYGKCGGSYQYVIVSGKSTNLPFVIDVEDFGDLFFFIGGELLAFKTREQAELFLKNNMTLIEDYLKTF